MGLKRYGTDGAWCEVENVRRYAAEAGWQDVEFVRRWDGTKWADCWTPLYFEIGGTGNLGSLGHVIPLEGGGAEMFLQNKNSEQITTYSAELCLNQYQTYVSSSTLTLDWERASTGTHVWGNASIFGMDAGWDMVMIGSKNGKNFDRTTTSYTLPEGSYRIFVTVQLQGGYSISTTLTVYGIKIDGKDIPIKL